MRPARNGASLALLALACAPAVEEPAAPPNLLLILADDLGVDKVSGYRLHPMPPRTPVIDGLIDEGLRFDRAYAYASCSPTRAALLTGRYGRRTGIGRPLDAREDAFELDGAEVGIPEVLASAGYTSAVVGKWHLATEAHAADHPAAFGFSRWSITLGNEGFDGYTQWEAYVDGKRTSHRGYLTSFQADEALRLIGELPEPWFVLLAFNAPHEPLHVPPRDLNFRGVTWASSDAEKYAAMVEAMDAEIGRVLDGLDAEVAARTTTLFLGDNGTPGAATLPPFAPLRAKTTLYEGGTRVPLVIAGSAVSAPGARVEGLVHVVDLLPTLAGLAGIEVIDHAIDGTSFLPTVLDPAVPTPRRHVFLEKFAPNGFHTPYEHETVGARDHRWRYLRTREGEESLHDLAARGSILDGPDLLRDRATLSDEARAALERLRDAVDAVVGADAR